MRRQLGPAPSLPADATTKAYVDASAGGGGGVTVSTKTGAYTVITSDGVILGDTTSAGFTITLPTAVGATKQYTIKKIVAANTLTIASTSGTIDGSASLAITAQYTALTFVSDGTNWFIV
jgi:hypothetical protein